LTKVNSGVIFEYQIRDHYEARGFHVVRSAGSRGEADLIAFNSSEVHLIQAKKEKRKYPKYADDIAVLRAVVCPSIWKKLLIVKRNMVVYIYDCTSEEILMQSFKVGDFKSGKIYKDASSE